MKQRQRFFAAGALVNKGPATARAAAGDDEYPKSLPASSPHAIAFSAAAVLDQRRVRHGTVDTATQLHVCQGARGKGQPILLKGITGDTVNTERTDVVFPVTTFEGKRHAIFMRNQTLVVDKETENVAERRRAAESRLQSSGMEVRRGLAVLSLSFTNGETEAPAGLQT